jgi:methyltransferase family protein
MSPMLQRCSPRTARKLDFKMGVEDQLKKVGSLYENNLREQGVSSRAVGWNTAESQNLRFEKLSSVIQDTTASMTINDYGCGYGAHLTYLLSRGIPVAEYHGYDISDSMLEAASKSLASFQGKLDLQNSMTINTNADYSFVSGTFNVRFEAADDDWKAFIHSKLDELDRNSRKGFAFNLLSTYVDWQEPHLYYGDPCYWFDFCKKHYSKYVTLLHDYPLYEWTIKIQKVVDAS